MFGGPEHRSSPTPSVTSDLLTTGSNTFSGAMLTSTESEHVGTNKGDYSTRIEEHRERSQNEGTMAFFCLHTVLKPSRITFCGLDSFRVFPLFLLVSLLGCVTIQPSREATSLLKCFGKESHGSVWFEGRQPKLDGLSVDLRWKNM